MYKYLLFDLDNTLLDFSKAERKALKSTFDEFKVLFNDTNVSIFKKYNKKYWELFEVGKISKSDLLVRRFNDFFNEIKIEGIDSAKFNKYYLNELGNGTEEIDHAYELLSKLGDYNISIITNGVTNTQNERIRKSRLNQYFDNIFISEQIGYQKPKKEFFDYVFTNLKIRNKDEVLLIDMHHIISDGITMSIIINEINKYYNKLRNKDHTQAAFIVSSVPFEYSRILAHLMNEK